MYWNESQFRRHHGSSALELFRLASTLAPLGTSRLKGYGRRAEPAINVWTSENALVVAALTPGVTQENLDIHIEDGLLTLHQRRVNHGTDRQLAPEPATTAAPSTTGATAAESTPSATSKTRREERTKGEFTRTLQLPFPVDPAGISAKIQKGILWITLPRAEADRPHKIPVVSAKE
ncbi:MAG TPA: Hsp20/alpha crystallin family protein [Planctomycetota bacterium]|jgi:HSP20 family protein|nr:Hsp20/alpha crystallin family protein [Planctomycetota bacterium]